MSSLFEGVEIAEVLYLLVKLLCVYSIIIDLHISKKKKIIIIDLYKIEIECDWALGLYIYIVLCQSPIQPDENRNLTRCNV